MMFLGRFLKKVSHLCIRIFDLPSPYCILLPYRSKIFFSTLKKRSISVESFRKHCLFYRSAFSEVTFQNLLNNLLSYAKTLFKIRHASCLFLFRLFRKVICKAQHGITTQSIAVCFCLHLRIERILNVVGLVKYVVYF